MSVGRFALDLVTGLSKVQAERDSANGAACDEEPPVMPIELAKTRKRNFISNRVNGSIIRRHIPGETTRSSHDFIIHDVMPNMP